MKEIINEIENINTYRLFETLTENEKYYKFFNVLNENELRLLINLMYTEFNKITNETENEIIIKIDYHYLNNEQLIKQLNTILLNHGYNYYITYDKYTQNI